MRYDNDHKQQARAEIVRKASARLRSDGIAPVGLRALMADAGLTHGAFYAHFQSRDELVEEAVGEALWDTFRSLTKVVERARPGDTFEAFVTSYLRPAHIQRPDRGCAAAALAPELARADPKLCLRFDTGVDRIAALLANQLPHGGTDAQRIGRARAIFAGLMGTLQLARASADVDRARSLIAEGRDAALASGRRPWASQA